MRKGETSHISPHPTGEHDLRLLTILTLYAWDRDDKSSAYKVAPGPSQVPSTASTISYSLNTDLLSLSLSFTDLVSTIGALTTSGNLSRRVGCE